MGNINGNVGTFDPNNVTVGSELALALTQTKSGGGIQSVGSEVISKQTFTYGTFEFTSRVSEALSGSDAGGFLYATNSETEIDMEQVGNKPDAVDCTNWHGVSNFQDTQVFGFDQTNSHDFKIVWEPPSSTGTWMAKLLCTTLRVSRGLRHTFVQYMGTRTALPGRHGNDWTPRYIYVRSSKVHQVVQSGNGVI